MRKVGEQGAGVEAARSRKGVEEGEEEPSSLSGECMVGERVSASVRESVNGGAPPTLAHTCMHTQMNQPTS